MTSIQKRAQALKNFRNFCAFVASEYNIEIHSHLALAACASKNSIYVPDVSLMSEKQINFIYGLVLHEIGHILHSDFSEEYFKQIPSPTQAFIANVLEDSREESLLCDTFEGASEIFQGMWDSFIGQDPELMKSLNWNFEDIDFFKCFTLWLSTFSHRYTKMDISIFENSMPEKTMAELKSFLEKSEFEKKYAELSTKLKTNQDVLYFTESINNLLLEYYPNPELQFMSLEDMKTAKYEVELKFKDFSAFVNEQVELIGKKEVELVNEQIQTEALLRKIKKDNQPNETKIKEIQQEISKINNKITNYQKFIGLDSVIDINEKIIEENKEAIKAREEKKQSIEEKSLQIANEIEQLINTLNSLEKSPKNEKKRATLEKRIASKKEKSAKITSRLEKSEKLIEKVHSKIEKSETYKENFSNAKMESKKNFKELKGKSNEEIEAMIEELQTNINKLEQKLSPFLEKQQEYMVPYQEKMELINDLRRYIFVLYSELGEETYETVMELTYELSTAFLADRLLPNISMSQTWPEMAKMQIKQDNKMSSLSGQIIVDGSMFCNDIANIQWLMEKIDEKIQSIDPVQEFKKHFNPCFKDQMPEFKVDTLYVMEDDSKVTSISHNVYTTEYDSIDYQNKLNPVLRAEHKAFCKKNAEKIEAIADTIAYSLQPKKQTRWLSNKRSGVLDTRSLWKYASGDENIFKVSENTYNQPTAATIMIDLSSSNIMSATAVEDMKIITQGISNALLDIEVEHEIIGYYAEVRPEMYGVKSSRAFNRRYHSLNTIIFKRFQDESNEGIQNISMQIADNSDGESLKMVVQRLSKQPANKKMVFMLSDFMPNMKGANTNLLTRDLQNAIKFAQQHQTKVYGFNTQHEILSSDLVDIHNISIKGIADKDVEKLEQEHFFDFLETVKQ